MANIDLQNLNPVFAQKFSAMLAAAKAAGINPGTIISGYRSVPQQAEIYARSHQGKDFMAAPPGDSMHNFGMAADVSSPDIQMLRRYANAHPELGIYPLPGDTPHFQLAGNQHELMANPPKLAGDFDSAGALKGYVGKGYNLVNNNEGTPVGAGSTTYPKPPEAYGYSTSTPNAVPGTNINSVPAAVAATPAGTPTASAAAPAQAQSPAEMIGQGNWGGALGAIGSNPATMAGIGDLSKSLGPPQNQQQVPAIAAPPKLETNQASIAQMAPQLYAQIMAAQQQRPGSELIQRQGGMQRPQIPGLSLGGFGYG